MKIGHCAESTGVKSWNGPTKLYELIESQKWDASIDHLQQSPLEAHEWVVRKVNDEITQCRLPIHEACIHNPPAEVIAALIKEYRGGVEKEDLNGMLPLHRACINGASLDVVTRLIHACPDALTAKDKWGKTPRDCLTVGCNEDSDLVAALEKTPTHYAARIAEQRLQNTLERKFTTMIKHIKKDAKSQQNASDAIIKKLKEKVCKMEEIIKQHNAKEQSLREENTNIKAESIKVLDELHDELLSENTKIMQQLEQMQIEKEAIQKNLEDATARNQALQKENKSYKQKITEVLNDLRDAMTHQFKEQSDKMKEKLLASIARNKSLQEENNALVRTNEMLTKQLKEQNRKKK